LGPPRPRSGGPWHLSSLVQWVLRHCRWRRTSSLTGVVVVCQHDSSTPSVTASLGRLLWSSAAAAAAKTSFIVDVACQVSGLSCCLSSSTMANHSLGDTRSTLHSVPTVATPVKRLQIGSYMQRRTNRKGGRRFDFCHDRHISTSGLGSGAYLRRQLLYWYPYVLRTLSRPVPKRFERKFCLRNTTSGFENRK